MKISTQTLTTDLDLTEILEVEGTLTLDPTKNVTITTTKNIIVTGKLISKPNPDVKHTIRFINIDENKFVGSGDTVLDTDIGLWCMNAGQLDLESSIKHDWKQYGTDYAAMESFAASIGSNMNIEGTATGQSHIFIKSSKPQSIKYVGFRYLGPRKDRDGDGVKELVTGRYAVHFHHCDEGSRGSIVEGCIARDCNNHCFVPHGSHGITFRNNIVYNVIETPFWYDFGHRTHDLVLENNLVVKVNYVPRAMDQDSDDAPTFGAGGFVLGSGDGNICRGNVVIGTSGDPRSAGGYIWPELRDDADNTKQLEDTWIFENNTGVNCPSTEQVWQNNLHHHINRNTTSINCQHPTFHGAYQNDYCRVGGYYKGGYVDIRAASATTNRIRFEGVTFDADGGDYCVIINEGPLTGAAPILFRNCKFINYKKAAILNQNPGAGKKNVDVVDCGITNSQVIVSKAALSGEFIRIQEGQAAWKITKTGSTAIAIFAPSAWGTGTGLLAEYFTPDFKTLLLSRVEPNINLFDLTHPGPHYKVPTSFAARWIGKIQPQYSESYTFYCKSGGGVRLWVNGILLIDSWEERYPGEIKRTMTTSEAGKLYDIKLEFFNSDDRSGCTLEWSSASLKREFIPMSQLYPLDVKPPDPVPNKAPVADAGIDQNIEITTILTGSGTDPEGGQLTYKWEQVGGLIAVTVSPTEATTKVTGLSKGENIFRLTVTDDKGSTGTDDVTVSVK
jgi:parallel beta-helix repeat protein